MSDTTSEYAELLARSEHAIKRVRDGITSMRVPVDETDADIVISDMQTAIRALEAKVREAEHWNESCEAENRQHILSLREHAQRLEDDRDRLAAEVAALRADAERYRWLRAHMTWYVDYEADGDAFVPFHRWYWNASPVVLELDAAIDAARGAGEGE